VRFSAVIQLLATFALLSLAPSARGDDPFDHPPIEYSTRTPNDCVSQLQARLESGEQQLEFQAKLGYLPAVLKALNVPIESQMLVYSQTSLQRQRISPRRPRAVYFSDDVYVGFCQSGNVLEVAAVDPQLGAVFYTIDQEQSEQPKFVRQTESCLVCHSSSRTDGVPGLLVRSLFVDRSGQPVLSEGSYTVDHRTPLEQRWGGWYVTGTHGAQVHLGNLVLPDRKAHRPIENKEGKNITDLSDRLRVQDYLAPHSDIVALMVLEHQALVHNRITQAGFVTRQALHYEAEMNHALGEPLGNRLESTTRRIKNAGDALVDALLLVDEARLTAPIEGTSGFAEKFASAGPRDRLGRSLRDLDLTSRLFKYPCSYLVYSKSFAKLPPAMKDYVWQRLWQVLTNYGESEKFAHLSADDRKSITDILRETVSDLPESWKVP
jgi:hypothetical protein